MHQISLWRQIQKSNFTDWKALIDFLELTPAQCNRVLQKPTFALNVPLRLAQKIKKGSLEDPILKQFLPLQEELEADPLFVLDPVADRASAKKPKLLHKYHGRALLLCTSACAMHCRFCFRQHYDYAISDKAFAEEVQEIASEPSLKEIILSGGDPLSLSNAQLGHLFDALNTIPHVKKIRFHTRFPIGIPERIDDEFLKLLEDCPKQMHFMLHCNHTRELDADIFARLKAIQRLGIPVLTQTVLLRRVNDDVETLRSLFEELSDNGILPYYLHQLDRVQGAKHFEVPEEEGKRLIAALEALLPGYAVPKYVKEIPHKPHKTRIF